ncbi:DUF222 domain-containing protein, partial [Nocardioides marmorisolisilvae]
MSRAHPVHPILRATATIGSALKDVVDVDPVFMATADKARALEALTAEINQMEALRLRLIANAQDVADRDACRSLAGWLETRTRTEHGPNLRSLRLAEALEKRWHQTASALTHGRVNLAQAEVIV